MTNMKHILSNAALLLVSVGLLAACSQSESKNANSETGNAEKVSFTMYKNEGCMCCTEWAKHMEANGYDVTEQPIDNLSAFKFTNKVPNDMGSCHTAIIDGYVVEGHVPAEDVDRLLKERPNAKGVAVPGMPIGSPGMENPNRPDDTYDVMIFQEDGSRKVYASH